MPAGAGAGAGAAEGAGAGAGAVFGSSFLPQAASIKALETSNVQRIRVCIVLIPFFESQDYFGGILSFWPG
jgi:hypothetical protein